MRSHFGNLECLSRIWFRRENDVFYPTRFFAIAITVEVQQHLPFPFLLPGKKFHTSGFTGKNSRQKALWRSKSLKITRKNNTQTLSRYLLQKSNLRRCRLRQNTVCYEPHFLRRMKIYERRAFRRLENKATTNTWNSQRSQMCKTKCDFLYWSVSGFKNTLQNANITNNRHSPKNPAIKYTAQHKNWNHWCKFYGTLTAWTPIVK